MKENIARLTEKIDRQRAELAATHLALLAIASALTAEQRAHALTTMATASAEKQATFEQIPSPATQEATRQFQEAEQRMYTLMQAAGARYGRR